MDITDSMPTITPLCKCCYDITFTICGLRKIFQPNRGSHTGMTFGWLQTNDCPFCRLLRCITGSIKYDHGDGEESLWDDNDPLRFLMGGDGRECRAALQNFKSIGPWITLGEAIDTNKWVSNNRVVLRPRLDAEISVSRIKRWLEHCDRRHENCLIRPSPSLPALLGLKIFRLIDLRSNCLFETADCPYYVALSYV